MRASLAAVELRALTGEPTEVRDLQAVLDDSPAYAHLVTGVPCGASDAQSTFSMLPDGKSYDDKFVLGIYDHAVMVGCIDLIRRFPDPSTAHIGLLLIAEHHQGMGLGTLAYERMERLVESWPECMRLRLGVLRDNVRAHRFWAGLGFVPTGEIKPYRYGTVQSESVIYTKAFPPPTRDGGDSSTS